MSQGQGQGQGQGQELIVTFVVELSKLGKALHGLIELGVKIEAIGLVEPGPEPRPRAGPRPMPKSSTISVSKAWLIEKLKPTKAGTLTFLSTADLMVQYKAQGWSGRGFFAVLNSIADIKNGVASLKEKKE